MSRLHLLLLGTSLCACQANSKPIPHRPGEMQPEKLADIQPLAGFQRVAVNRESFGAWLHTLPLRKDNTVYLYNGRQKDNQSAQYAVVDLPVGKKDLQQCADVVMRLRAEYLLSQQQSKKIVFNSTSGQPLSFSKWLSGTRYKLSGNRLTEINTGVQSTDPKSALNGYLEVVFAYCGTQSLQQQLVKVNNVTSIAAGDVFIKGGFPGHAMLVTDIAEGKNGEKLFMLAQGYMPAQDIHVVRNPSSNENTPWYSTKNLDVLETPEWTFGINQLYTWP